MFHFVQRNFAALRVDRRHSRGGYSHDGIAIEKSWSCHGRHPAPSEVLTGVSRACRQSNAVAEGKHIHYDCLTEGEGAVLSSGAVGPNPAWSWVTICRSLQFLGHQVPGSDLRLSITPFLTRAANEELTAMDSPRGTDHQTGNIVLLLRP